jgi:hypothetical protein
VEKQGNLSTKIGKEAREDHRFVQKGKKANGEEPVPAGK